MTDFAAARRAMVDNQVATSSVTDRRLLAAMRRIPRERFVPEAERDLAYIDRDVPLSADRVLSAPAPFARLVQLAGVGEGDKVLDAGAAGGYSAAVLAALGGRVVALEADPALAEAARENLTAEGATATVVVGQLQAAAEAPFDVVVVEDVVDAVPPQLLALLGDGGRLVALIRTDGGPATATLFTRQGGSIASKTSFDALARVRETGTSDLFVF